MIKKNYSAWKVDDTTFSDDQTAIEKLTHFARYAVLAPSGHNTQPWLFVKKDNSLSIQVNPERHLGFSGKLAAEPYVSLGSCVETFRLAALSFGYELEIDETPQKKDIFTVRIGKKVAPNPALRKAILQRVSNRNLYSQKKTPKKLLDEICNEELSGVSVSIFDDPENISFFAEKTAKATREIMAVPEFRNELSLWVRNNVTKQYDGMPGAVQGMPLPPSVVAKHVVKNIDVSKSQAKLDAKRVINSSALILLSIDSESELNSAHIGRLYANICIKAQTMGLSSSGVGASVIDPGTKADIIKKFNLKHSPTALIRLGKTDKKAPNTPRWPLEKVLI